LKEKTNIDIEGIRNLEKGSNGRGNDLFFNLREKRLGEACPVRKVLKHEACLLPQFPNRLPDMKFLYFMFDIVRNHT
jgi:hypothetical protein